MSFLIILQALRSLIEGKLSSEARKTDKKVSWVALFCYQI